MKIGYCGWTWISNEYNNNEPINDRHKENVERYLREVSDLGYQIAELPNWVVNCYADNFQEFVDVINKYEMKFENLYFYFSDDPERDYDAALRDIEIMQRVGAHYMNLQGVMWSEKPYERPLDRETVLAYAALADRIGKACKAARITACMHPHANTAVYHRDAIELFLENSDAKYVSLCMDTAHTTLAGIDPVEFVRTYGERIAYMHLKDVDPDVSLNTEWPMKRFRPLGYGCVNFKGVVKMLKQKGFDGILCVELDYQPVCNYRSAQVSRAYLHNVLRL